MSQSIQYPNWCFTYNYGGSGQFTKDDVLEWWEHLDSMGVHYAVGGWEVAPTSGQLHLQGYVQFETKKRLEQLKKLGKGPTVHWERAKGDEDSNELYCTKSGDIIRLGEEPRHVHAGKRERKRWADTLEACKQGRWDDADPQIQIQFCRSLDYLRSKYRKDPADNEPGTTHLWLWGPAGTGKSRQAREIFASKGMEFYYKMQNKWWDFYRDQPGVLIDDLEITNCQHLISHLKAWLDMYKFTAEFKGGAVSLRPKFIIITSNFHPWDIMCQHEKEWYEPFMRRLTVQYVGPAPEPQKGPPILNPTTSSGSPDFTPIKLVRSDTVCPGAPARAETPYPHVVVLDGEASDDDSDIEVLTKEQAEMELMKCKYSGELIKAVLADTSQPDREAAQRI